MRVLLDTCTFLWTITGSKELSRAARQIIADPDNDVFLSAVSTWEIAVKHALGRLPLPRDPVAYIPEKRAQHGIAPLSLDEGAALFAAKLPPLHADPFDRALICQAIAGGLVILTPDEEIRRYAVRVEW